MFSIRKATTSDIDVIRHIAHTTWPVSYKGIITEEQISYMLEKMYSEAVLKDQIEHLRHQFVLAYNDEIAVGFASYSPKPGDETNTCRLNKLYLLPDQQGKGTGKKLLGHIIEEIKTRNIKALELNVNKYNSAFHFYTKNGFVITGEEVLDIGNGFVMDDYVMTLALQVERS